MILVHKQYILWFNISMYDIISVEVLHSFEKRLDNLDNLLLWQTSLVMSIVHNDIKQLATSILLSDNVNVAIIFVAVYHLHDGRMVDTGEKVYFSLNVIESTNLGLVDGLDGVDGASGFVETLAYISVGSSTENGGEDAVLSMEAGATAS